ncbi:hypothetical protein AUJ67_05065, partial [Candidatus Desantisbacteria bacterium CG1_02_49_89]
RSYMKNIKVVVMGAGSLVFGRGMITDLLSDENLRKVDPAITLVDTDEKALDRMLGLSKLLKERLKSNAAISATPDRKKALEGADYIISAVTKRRMDLWEKDFFVPNSFGFRQAFGECGGPGAAFHTLRNLNILMPICKDAEQICPDAWFMSFSNPENRIVMGIKYLTKLKVMGMCHGVFGTRNAVARILGRKDEEVDITVAGINHFHWVLKAKDVKTGKDLLPEMNEKLSASDCGLAPLVKRMYDVFGLLPFPSPDHIAEYVAFGYDLTGPDWFTHQDKVHASREEKHNYGVFAQTYEDLNLMADGKKPVPDEMLRHSGEIATSVIASIELDRKKRELAMTIPNEGPAISNLPEDAIVEVPAVVDAKGIHAEKVGPLPEPIAAMIRTQITIQKLVIEAFRQKSKKILLQALALDPVVDSLDNAKEMMDQMIRIEEDFLPELK